MYVTLLGWVVRFIKSLRLLFINRHIIVNFSISAGGRQTVFGSSSSKVILTILSRQILVNCLTFDVFSLFVFLLASGGSGWLARGG